MKELESISYKELQYFWRMQRFRIPVLFLMASWLMADLLPAQDTLDIHKAMQAVEKGDYDSGILLFKTSSK